MSAKKADAAVIPPQNPAETAATELDAAAPATLDAGVIDAPALDAPALDAPALDTALLGAPETGAPESTPTGAAGGPLAPTRAPRIRWAAIIWGAIAVTIAVVTLIITGSVERRAAFMRWSSQLSGGDIWLLAILLVGALILLFGLLAVLRRRA